MSPQFPKLGVYYRIQNVDLATFLSVADISLFKPRLVTRPLKEHDKSQLWQFENEGNGWRIVNRSSSCCHNCSENHEEGPICYLDINDDGPLAKLEEDGGSHQLWMIKHDHHSPPGIFSIAVCNNPYNNLLCLHEENVVGLEVVTGKGFHAMADKNLWKISEIWPTLQDTTYRIRNLNGLALTMTSEEINVKALELGSFDQLWALGPKANGLHTIQNVSQEAFLAKGPEGRIARVAPGKAHIWKLEGIDGFAQSIDTSHADKKPIEANVLGFTVCDGNQVILKPKRVGDNQTWLFEATERSQVEEEKRIIKERKEAEQARIAAEKKRRKIIEEREAERARLAAEADRARIAAEAKGAATGSKVPKRVD